MAKAREHAKNGHNMPTSPPEVATKVQKVCDGNRIIVSSTQQKLCEWLNAIRSAGHLHDNRGVQCRQPRHFTAMTVWQKWRDHPEKVWVRQVLFQLHFWAGVIAGAYV